MLIVLGLGNGGAVGAALVLLLDYDDARGILPLVVGTAGCVVAGFFVLTPAAPAVAGERVCGCGDPDCQRGCPA